MASELKATDLLQIVRTHASSRPTLRGATLRPARAVARPVLAALLAFITIGSSSRSSCATCSRYPSCGRGAGCLRLHLVLFSARRSAPRATFTSASTCSPEYRRPPPGVQRLIIDLACWRSIVYRGHRRQFSQLSVPRLSPALGITLFVPTIVIPMSGVPDVDRQPDGHRRDSRQIVTGVSHDPGRSAPDPLHRMTHPLTILLV